MKTYRTMETFDDGTPLSFYRQQVAKMYGSGGGGGSGGYSGGGGSGGYQSGGGGGRGGRMAVAKYPKGRGGGRGGRMVRYKVGGGGGGGGGQRYMPSLMKQPKLMPNIKQLYTNSFKYQNMLMGGGFLKSDGFGPSGKHTSQKWKGYAKVLISNIKQNGPGGYGGDKLTNVEVVPSGATDYYMDSYVTMIANTLKNGGHGKMY